MIGKVAARAVEIIAEGEVLADRAWIEGAGRQLIAVAVEQEPMSGG